MYLSGSKAQLSRLNWSIEPSYILILSCLSTSTASGPMGLPSSMMCLIVLHVCVCVCMYVCINVGLPSSMMCLIVLHVCVCVCTYV